MPAHNSLVSFLDLHFNYPTVHGWIGNSLLERTAWYDTGWFHLPQHFWFCFASLRTRVNRTRWVAGLSVFMPCYSSINDSIIPFVQVAVFQHTILQGVFEGLAPGGPRRWIFWHDRQTWPLKRSENEALSFGYLPASSLFTYSYMLFPKTVTFLLIPSGVSRKIFGKRKQCKVLGGRKTVIHISRDLAVGALLPMSSSLGSLLSLGRYLFIFSFSPLVSLCIFIYSLKNRRQCKA